MADTAKTGSDVADIAAMLGPDYENIEPLGEEGGLSRLYRARKISLGTDVVIKRMEMRKGRPEEVRREVDALVSLRHQYLPRVYAFETDGRGSCCTVMDLIPGCTLREYVEEHGALDQKQMLKWLKQLCETLVYMHSRGILHSDLKPENIMITPEGNICVIDFNTSLVLSEGVLEAVGASRGYAAPEQYNIPLRRLGKREKLSDERKALYDICAKAQKTGKVGPRTDLYGMGAVAYFMITGYDPACWCDGVVPLSRYRITLGDPLRMVIERCMEKDSRKRFASAESALQALNSLEKTDSRYRAWRRSCRTAILVTGAGLIVSLFLLVQGSIMVYRDRGETYSSRIREAQQMLEEQDAEQAEDLLMEAVSMDPDRPEAYALLGELLYSRGDWQQGVDLLSQADPDDTGALSEEEAAKVQGQIQYLLASCWYRLEEYDSALLCYQTAAGLCPEEPDFQRDLAVCFARLGRTEQAQEALDTFSEMDASPGDVELVTGEILCSQGKWEEALEQLKQAAERSGDHDVILRAAVQAAECCRQAGGRTLEEEELLEKAAGRLDAGENGALLQLQGEACMRLAEEEQKQDWYRKALTCFDTLMNRGNTAYAVRQNAALAHEYLEEFDQAEQLLLDLQEDFPEDYRPPMRLALLYWHRESLKEADSRNFDDFTRTGQQAEDLYSGTEADGEMSLLQEYMAQLGLQEGETE